MTPSEPRVGILTGPTATGKTGLAIELCHEAQARGAPPIEIVNADSLLVYREMDIGTAKPTPAERKGIPHHLIDIRSPSEAFTAGDFVKEAEAAIAAIHARGARALIVGGTGFYLKGLLYGLWDVPKADPSVRERIEKHSSMELFQQLEKKDPQSAYRIGPADRYRLVRAHEILAATGKTPSELEKERPQDPNPRYELWVLDREDRELHPRITERTRAMLGAGLIDEVKTLLERYPGARPLQAVGYAETVAFLEGRLPQGRKIPPGIPGLESEISLATRQLVKKQRTWFRGEPASNWFRLEAEEAQAREAFWRLYG